MPRENRNLVPNGTNRGVKMRVFGSGLSGLFGFGLILSFAGVTGCASPDADTEELLDSVITSIAVLPEDEPFVSLAQEVQLQVRAENSAGTEVPGGSVTWTSSDTSILKLSNTGLMRGVRTGTATVSATVDSVRGATPFRVVDLSGRWLGGEEPDTVSYTLTQTGTSVTGVFRSRLGFPPITDVNTGTLTGSLNFGRYSHDLELTTETGCVLRITGTHKVLEESGGKLILIPGNSGDLNSTNCSLRGTIDFTTLRRQ